MFGNLGLRVRSVAGLCLLSLGVAACGTSAVGARPDARALDGVVTYAEQAGFPPAWIFPLFQGADLTVQYQGEFEWLMIPPLYQYGSGANPTINYNLSLGYPPVYSNNNTTIVIRLKHWIWSDGQPVTTRDISFWMNELEANKAQWALYNPGYFPDNVKSFQINGPYEFTLNLTRGYSSTWFTEDQLTQIIPMPQHAWDKTSANGAVGNYDETPAGAQQVFQFLDNQSKDLSSYATNPLWKVVYGPWRLVSFSVLGRAVFEPNLKYSGPDKPQLKEFIEVPFVSNASEYNALRAGELDFGYIPSEDGQAAAKYAVKGYTVAQWPVDGFNSLLLNFHNPKVGPIFGQLYIRQTMERLINQPAMIKDLLGGFAQPTYGPVTNGPAAFLSSAEKHYPYPYNVSAAKALLKSHGWTVRPSGVTTCAKPGTGTGECGSGIAGGARLSFNVVDYSSQQYQAVMMDEWKTASALVGIQINISTTANVYAEAVPCTASQADCSWQILNWGGAVVTLEYDPVGSYFDCGEATNYGSYCSATEMKDSVAAEAPGGSIDPWENYLVNNLPMLWEPDTDYTIIESKKDLKGALPENGLLSIFPQLWHYSN